MVVIPGQEAFDAAVAGAGGKLIRACRFVRAASGEVRGAMLCKPTRASQVLRLFHATQVEAFEPDGYAARRDALAGEPLLAFDEGDERPPASRPPPQAAPPQQQQAQEPHPQPSQQQGQQQQSQPRVTVNFTGPGAAAMNGAAEAEAARMRSAVMSMLSRALASNASDAQTVLEVERERTKQGEHRAKEAEHTHRIVAALLELLDRHPRMAERPDDLAKMMGR